MKAKRQAEILRIIGERDVETQEQLLELLRERGITATQATVSRDIKYLHIVKEQTGRGSYKYAAASGRKLSQGETGRLRTIFREGVTSLDVAQNIVVLKTMPGLASAACAAIDAMEMSDLLGSLAGDDTAILILRTNAAATAFCGEISTMLDG